MLLFNKQNRIETVLRATLIASLLAGTASAATCPQTPYESETYGHASGDTPLPNFGLVLELVDGHSAEPKLRLFGGVPGNKASILISTEMDSKAGSRGETTLVAGQSIALEGTFDWMGYYEVSLPTLPENVASMDYLYAQGIQTGAAGIDPERGTFLELSNGVAFAPLDDGPETPFSLLDLAPRLPEHGQNLQDLIDARGLEEKLRAALNSDGDEIVIKLEIGASVAIYACINVGGEVGLEAKVTRRDDGRYDVEFGADMVAKAGVEACEGVEANMGQGVGGTRIFRFHSVSGVVRGLVGLVLSQRFPDLQPARFLADHGVFDTMKAKVEEFVQGIRIAEEKLEAAEQMLWNAAGLAVENAQERARAARRDYLQVWDKFVKTRFPSGALYVRLGMSYATYQVATKVAGAAERSYTLAKTVADHARNALDTLREMHAQAIDAMAQIGRIALIIAQTGTFARDHYAGFEVRLTTSSEAEAMIGIPGVKLANFGTGVEREFTAKVELRWEYQTEHSPRVVTVTQEFEMRSNVSRGKWVGGEFEGKMSLTLVDVFEIGQGVTRWAEHSARVTLDNRISGIDGFIVTLNSGIGRTVELWISQDDLLKDAANIFCLLKEDGPLAALDGMGSQEIGFSVQDRVEDSVELGVSASYVGYGGSFEASIQWSDQGPKLEKSTTIHDAVESLVGAFTR